MDPIIVPIVGVILSVIFFSISYRKSVSAKNERIDNTNKEIVAKLFNRIITENFTPSQEFIEKYIEGKSIDKKLKRSDLFSIEQVVAKLYSEILDNEILDVSKRKEKLSIVENISYNKYSSKYKQDGNQNASDEEETLELIPLEELKLKNKISSKLPFTLGVISSLAGALISLGISSYSVLDSNSIDIENFLLRSLDDVLGVFILSLAIIGIWIISKRFLENEKSETVQLPKGLSTHLKLENEVVKILQSKKLKFFIPNKDSRLRSDYIVKKGKIDIPIELKSWTIKPNQKSIENAIYSVESDIAELDSPFGLIITSEKVNVNLDKRLLKKGTVKLLSMEELKNENFA